MGKGLEFDPRIFKCVIIAAACSFLTSAFAWISNDIALRANINQGISSAAISAGSNVITSIAARLFYNEILTWLQISGIVVSLLGIVMIGIYDPKEISHDSVSSL